MRRPMKISLFKHAQDKHPEPFEGDWDAFCANVIGTTHKHYLGDKVYVPAFSPAEYPPGTTRDKLNVTRVWLVCLDFDDITLEQWQAVIAMLDGYRMIAYTSYSYQEAKAPTDPVRVRLVLDLSRPVLNAEWPRFWLNLTSALPAPVDIKCKDSSRLYFLPYTPNLEVAAIHRDDGREALEVDSILARPTPAEAMGKQPLTTSQPITADDLRDYAKRLARKADPEAASMGRWLVAICDGRAFAFEGTRHDTMLQITAHVERAFPHATIENLTDLFRGSLIDFGRLDPGFSLEAETAAVSVALDGIRAKRLTEAAQRALAHEAHEESLIRDAFRSGRSEAYSEAELDRFADAAGVDRQGFAHRWIVQHGASYYVFVDGEYRAPVVERALVGCAQRDLAPAKPAGVVTVKPDERGLPRWVRKTVGDLLADYGTVARHGVATFCAERSYYDAATQKIYEAVCPQRLIPPVYSEAVDNWLKLLGGKDYEKLLLWLKLVFNLNEPLAALYFEGVPGSGKSLFAEGVARIWSTTGPVDATDATDHHNDMTTSNPLVFADEKLPPLWARPGGFGHLRQFIATRSRALNRKYLSRVPLVGCTRLILAANNQDLIKNLDALTPDDRAAVAQRLLHIHAGVSATRYLEGLGTERVDRFVDNDEIAAHAVWLRENLKVPSQGRFGVLGDPALAGRMKYGQINNAAVAEWLIGFILDPQRLWNANQANRKVAVIADGKAMINVRAINTQSNWQVYVSKPKDVLGSQEISNALSELSEPGRVNRKNVWYRVADAAALAAHAEELGLTTPDQIASALAKDYATTAAVRAI